MKITRAIPGGPDGLAIVIDGEDGPVRVTADSWEFLDVAVSPDNRLNLQNLGGDRGVTGWVRRCVLNIANHLASAIDPDPKPIITAERGEWDHVTVLPKVRETYKVGTVAAKIFPQRVWSGSFSPTHDLAPLVDGIRGAVRSSERAEVALNAFTPQKGMEFRVARQGCEAHYRAAVV